MSAPGSWPSPLTAADVAAAGVELRDVDATDDGRTVWWSESRPAEGGRTTVLRRDGDGPAREVVPAGFDARTRLHEYGGRCWLPTPQGLVTSREPDQRLCLVSGDDVRPLTPDDGARYGDPQLAGDVVVVVRERLRRVDRGPRTDLVAVPLAGGEPVVLWDASHFVGAPRVSADGRLAFLTWEHPQMPWDGTTLRVGALERALDGVQAVLGGPQESVFQPEWEASGALRAVTDRSGWWNLVRDGVDLWPTEQECGWPAWVAGYASHATLSGGAVAVVHGRSTKALSVLEPGGVVRPLDLPFTAWRPVLAASGTTVVGVAAAPTRGWAVVAVDTATGAWREVAGGEQPDPAWAPVPEQVEVPSVGGRTTFANLYPPTAPDQDVSARAPWVVFVHGGPTSQVPAVYDAEKAYFTSRGIGVADVDYGGSTGQGRAYRELLRGQWGVVDVEDCEAVARHLLDTGRASAVVIRGGSAGGWTVLAALSRGGSVFAAGTSYYGVVDLLPFAQTTHDFESRYLDGLIGPLPEARDRYVERSPLSHLDTLDRPLLVLQGLEDKVVPPAQAELLVEALAARGLPHAYLPFAGEGHGFTRADSITRALEAELSFYGQVLGFEVPGVPVLPLS